MLLSRCPYCGERDEAEFNCGGEAHISRPMAASTVNDAEFAEYLFMRDNPKGLVLERWLHAAGCRRWFNMARDTVSNEIVEVYPMGEGPKAKPAVAAHKASWRRTSRAEVAARPARTGRGRR